MHSVTMKVHFKTGARSRKTIVKGEAGAELPARIPRVAKLMALAIRFEQLIRDGVVRDYRVRGAVVTKGGSRQMIETGAGVAPPLESTQSGSEV